MERKTTPIEAFESRLAGLFIAVAALLAVLAMTGCGDGPTPPEQPGAATAIAEAETTVEEPEAMVSDDIPTGVGTRLTYLANTPGTPVEVKFDLEGPWNFDSGPSTSTLTIAFIAKETAPSQDQFPDAVIAARSSWDTPGNVEYNFQDKDAFSWRSYGRFGPRERLLTYSAGVRALVFPVAVGNSWTEVYSQTVGGRTTDINAENLVVARNRLTVPAGTFDAFLLQTKVTVTSGGESATTWDYIWFAPGIGRAAEIISRPDEPREVFDTANSFYRLVDF